MDESLAGLGRAKDSIVDRVANMKSLDTRKDIAESGRFWPFWPNFVKNQQKFQQFLTKKWRVDNRAKECIV